MATDLTFANPLSVLPFRASYATLSVELTFWGWRESSKAICADAVVCMANSGVHSDVLLLSHCFPSCPLAIYIQTNKHLTSRWLRYWLQHNLRLDGGGIRINDNAVDITGRGVHL